MVKKSKAIQQRPIDPTRNAKDVIGDTTGLTGITTGSPRQSSAEPNDIVRDDEHLPASLKNFPKEEVLGIPNSAVYQKAYKKKIIQGMSKIAAKASEDTANESRTTPAANMSSTTANSPTKQTNNSIPPSVQGEQSISGDMPTPDADDNTLANAQEMGEQLGEDEEHPKPVDLGRDIDQAEQRIKEK